jgi:hypothetical protein
MLWKQAGRQAGNIGMGFGRGLGLEFCFFLCSIRRFLPLMKIL